MAENKPKEETKNTAPGNTENNQENQATNKAATEKPGAAAGDSIKETINKAKDTAGQAATQVAGKAQEKATAILGEQKSNLAAGIGSIADSVRHIGEDLQDGGDGEKNQIAAFAGQYGDSLAEQIERVSHYVEDKDFREIARDAEQFARRKPALFVGGAFVLGILAARIFKSSGAGRTDGNRQLSGSREETNSAKAAVQTS